MNAALRRLALWAAATVAPCGAQAADAFVAELEQRLAATGVDAVNDHLSAAPDGALLARFARRTASCELPAVSLAIRLARGANVRAVQAHEESLRVASGRCARFVLALVPAAEVPRVCASLPSWGAAQTARELRRRIAGIDADTLLRRTAQGRACRAAYRYELENTRVTLRVAALPPAKRPHLRALVFEAARILGPHQTRKLPCPTPLPPVATAAASMSCVTACTAPCAT